VHQTTPPWRNSALCCATRPRVVEALCQPEQTYVSLWSHGAGTRKHLHIAVQPVTAAVVARYGGLRSEQLRPGCWQAATSRTWPT
jgi:hypothetical protein